MSKSLLRTDKEIAEIYNRHGKTIYRVCFAYMKKPPLPYRDLSPAARS